MEKVLKYTPLHGNDLSGSVIIDKIVKISIIEMYYGGTRIAITQIHLDNGEIIWSSDSMDTLNKRIIDETGWKTHRN